LRRPILYADINFQLHLRGKTWDKIETVKEMVVAGTLTDIKLDKRLKRKILSKIKTKSIAKSFDLERIRIIDIKKHFELGLGYMNSKC